MIRGFTRLELLRKGLHALSSLFMLFYLLPQEVYGVNRKLFLFVPFVFFIALEFYRVSRGILLWGMRPYERNEMSGYVWAGASLVLAILLFPPHLVVPVYVCWAWLDPLCSLFKRRAPLYPVVPFALYVALFLLLARALAPGEALPQWGALGDVTAAVLCAGTALALEYPVVKGINDDFLMVFGPLALITSVAELLL